MTLEELAGMLEEIGFPFAYDHFAEGESPDTHLRSDLKGNHFLPIQACTAEEYNEKELPLYSLLKAERHCPPL